MGLYQEQIRNEHQHRSQDANCISNPLYFSDGFHAAQSLSVINEFKFPLLNGRDLVEFAHVHKVAGDGCCCGHNRAYQVRAAVFALATLEIAIAGAGAALVRRQDVGVHADAHAAAGVAPLESGGAENFVEAFLFGLRFDTARAGNNQRLLDVFRHVLAFDKMRGGPEIIEARIGARADEHAVHGNIHDGRAGFEPHVFESAFRGFLIVEILEVMRIGNAGGDAGDHSRIGAPGDLRSNLLRLQLDLHVKVGAAIALEQLPALDGFLKRFAARNKRPAFEISEGGFVRRDHAGARAALNGHVADGHAPVHRKGANGFAAVFRDVAVAAGDARFSDDGKNQVLCRDALGPLAMHENVQRLRARLHEALRCEDVLDFAGADAESQRSKRAVRGSVAVTANNRLPGLRDAQLRADNVHDALVLAVHVKQANARFAAIFFQSIELELGVVIEDGQRAVCGRDRMIHHGEGEIGAADFAAFGAKAGESLGRGAFVNEVTVDINDRGLAGLLVNDVGVPDFLIERFRRHSVSIRILALLWWEANGGTGKEE